MNLTRTMFTTLSWNAPWAGRRRLPRRPSVRRPRLEVLENRCLLSLDSLVVRAAPNGPLNTTTTSVAAWTDVPDLSGRITTAAGSDLEITVAGEAYTTGKGMFLQALVDGQPTSPSDVLFAAGSFTGTHSFTFAKTGLGAGPHQVKVQWWADAGGTAFIGDRTLTLDASPEVTETGGLVVRAAPSGPFKTTSVAAWTDVPDLSGRITTAAGSDLEITVAGEAYTTGKGMFLQALVDGQPTSPSDVLFAEGGLTGTHSFTFAKTGLGAGPHEVKVQWSVDAGGTAFIGDRTLTLDASPEVTATGGLVVKAAPSGPFKTTSVAAWTDVPDLSGRITTAAGSNLEITVAGEVETTAGKRMFIRALVDGQPTSPHLSDVVFADGGLTGTHSFTFAKTGLGAGPHEVKVQWSIDAGGPPSSATAP